MGNSMTAHCETAQKTGTLTLSRSKRKKLPPAIGELAKSLRTLDISENHFVTMNEVVGNFPNLKKLDMSHNRLTELPETIDTLIKLESLVLNSNHICRLPQTALNLPHLKQVNLSDNSIVEFPLAFCGLRHLDVLDLSKNKLTCVPDAASGLHVVELNLNQNEIATVSEKLAECPRLRTLRLEENCLQLDAVPVRILKDSKVSTLTLDGNLFETKKLADVEGYDNYMERYTAVKKKMF